MPLWKMLKAAPSQAFHQPHSGVKRHHVLAYSYEQNLEIIRRMGELGTLGCPLLLGCSRKSVIGLTLDLPVEERLEGTLVTTVVGVLKGCGFVRVHDVKENLRAVKMAEAIREYSDKSFAGC